MSWKDVGRTLGIIAAVLGILGVGYAAGDNASEKQSRFSNLIVKGYATPERNWRLEIRASRRS